VPPQPHVLVVDDEPALRELMADALESEGYRVSTASNGSEALEALRLGAPDLIVLDLMMPVLDGWTFIDTYGEVAGTEIPIIGISAVLSAAATERLKGLGAVCCLPKPFDLGVLLDCAANLLRGDSGLQLPA
jgi:CheY-like chemotaxis protein